MEEMKWMSMWNEVRSTLFIVKLLEAKQSREIMALKLPESWQVTRKQKVS